MKFVKVKETTLVMNSQKTISTGAGPCRQCLKPFDIGKESRILFAYQPVKAKHAYAQVGPVYIHSNECHSYPDIHEFPREIKYNRKDFPITLRCYDNAERMIHAELVGDRQIEDVIEKLFENPQISFLHTRNAEYGCFIAKIERAQV
jgi:hypothetical protein